jgi:putative ubiquitin-RnfH superfamily antitoxin RatB of RatAB toxin-antitoxin module
MVASEHMTVEVAYALPDEQLILSLEAEPGITVEQAIQRSGILEHFADIDLAQSKVGIFGKLAKLTDVLNPGDRVEIYRPLIADPKEARKKRAAEGKVMRKGARAANAEGDSGDSAD